MTIQDLGVFAEIFAAIATVGSLIYVGVQIQNNTRATRATSVRESLYQLSDWNREIAGNPEMARMFETALQEEMPDFTQAEWNKMTRFCFSLFHIYEAQYINAKFDVGMGDAAEPYLQDARTVIDALPVFKKFWAEEKAANHWTAGFVEAVEGMAVGSIGGLNIANARKIPPDTASAQ
jgi:hypothetical protein